MFHDPVAFSLALHAVAQQLVWAGDESACRKTSKHLIMFAAMLSNDESKAFTSSALGLTLTRHDLIVQIVEVAFSISHASRLNTEISMEFSTLLEDILRTLPESLVIVSRIVQRCYEDLGTEQSRSFVNSLLLWRAIAQ